MEYFKKLQVYVPETGIVDAPVSIEEICIMQEPIEKKILGRISFVNRSIKDIIAIFVRISVRNIANEDISLEKERYIYQDVIIKPGELYGNKVPVNLPDDTRILLVELEKVVFSNGDIWSAEGAVKHEVVYQEINVPYKFYYNVFERIQNELKLHFSSIDYIRYYYREDDYAWQCSCGRLNSNSVLTCPFCKNSRDTQRSYLTVEKISCMIQEKEEEIRVEEEQNRLRDLEEKKKKEIEYNQKLKKWEEEERERREKEEKKKRILRKKRKKRNIIVATISLIAILGISGFIIVKKIVENSTSPQYKIVSMIKKNKEYYDKLNSNIDQDYSDFIEEINNSSVEFCDRGNFEYLEESTIPKPETALNEFPEFAHYFREPDDNGGQYVYINFKDDKECNMLATIYMVYLQSLGFEFEPVEKYDGIYIVDDKYTIGYVHDETQEAFTIALDILDELK